MCEVCDSLTIHCAAACIMFCIVETVPVGCNVVVMLMVLCAAECG